MEIDSEWRMSGERGWIIIDGVRMEAWIYASPDESTWTWNLTFNGDDHAGGRTNDHRTARQKVYGAARKLANAVNQQTLAKASATG